MSDEYAEDEKDLIAIKQKREQEIARLQVQKQQVENLLKETEKNLSNVIGKLEYISYIRSKKEDTERE